MSEEKENPKVTPKESPKDTSEETQQVDLSRLFEGKASQGKQGIFLAPRGSQATNPFPPQDPVPANKPETTQAAPVDTTPQDSVPANKPETPPSTQPTQDAPTDTTPQSKTPSPSQTALESSDE